MTTERVPVHGGELHVEVEGDGPVVVLVHAGVANLRMWDPHVPALAERFQVVRYDTRGYGRTDSEHVEFSNRDDLGAVLDHVGAASASVVGASRGGMIALDFALEQPQRVDSLAVVSGGIGGYSSPAGEAQAEFWQRADQLWEAKEWEALADLETRHWVDGPGQPPDRVDPSVRTQVHHWILETYEAEKEEGIPVPLDPPAWERLDRFDGRLLVVVGDLDDAATQDACFQLAERVDGSRLEVFPGAAHMLNLEQPERFTSLLLEFLEGADA